jgi:hypothetical protein
LYVRYLLIFTVAVFYSLNLPSDAVLGAPYGPSVLHILHVSVHRTDLQFFTCCMSSVHRTDLQFFTCCSPRCNVQTFSSSHATVLGAPYEPLVFHMLHVLGAPYGTSVLHMLQSLMHRTDLQFFTCCSPRCTLRSFSISHAAVLGAPDGTSVLHTLQNYLTGIYAGL